MRSILYLIAVICVIGWIFGFFFAGTGSPNNLIHILLVLAVIAILISVIKRA